MNRQSGFSDSIQLAAAVIGMFVFFTGIPSLPQLLRGAGGRPSATPDVAELDLFIAIPVFIVFFLVLSVLYYFTVVIIHRFLWRSGVRYVVTGYKGAVYAEGGGIFDVLIVVVGISLSFLLFRVWWGPLQRLGTTQEAVLGLLLGGLAYIGATIGLNVEIASSAKRQVERTVLKS